MAVSTTPLSSPFTNAIVLDQVTNATSENNVRGGASTIFVVDIDNSSNGAISYWKAWNNTTPVVGTTDPDIILPAAASARTTWICLTGYPLLTALSFAGVTTAGTPGTSNPSSSVITRILCS